MARPFQTRVNRRVPVSVGSDSQPQLQVVAPLEVKTPGAATSPLMGLVQALGIGAAVAQKANTERKDYYHAQGVADEQIGTADPSKAPMPWRKSYSDGAFETATLEQYQAAEAKVSQRASEELDHSLPMDEQIHIIDGWMKEELGPLTADPRAKLLFAKRYQSFIDTTAANIQKAQIDAHASAALDATATDMGSTIERTGAFTQDDWNAAFHRTNSQLGDPVKTRDFMVNTIMQQAINAAAQGRDYKQFRDMIPTQTIGPDGSTLPGPMRSPEVRGMVEQAMDKAERLYDDFHTNEYAAAQASAFVDMNDMVNAGADISLDTFAAKKYSIGNKPNDLFSPERAASLIDQAKAVRARMVAAQAEQDSFDQIYAAHPRMADAKPFFPSAEKFNDWAQNKYVSFLKGMGLDEGSLGGGKLLANPQAVDAIGKLSAQEGVAYGPLKVALSTVNPQAAGDVLARVDAYNHLKTLNLTGMYVDDDSALIYEAVDGWKVAGVTDPKVLAENIQRMGDHDTVEYVSTNLRQVKELTKGIVLKPSSMFSDAINSNQTVNAGYVTGTYRSLLTSALSKGMPLESAKQFAQERLMATHSIIQVSGESMLLPNAVVPDPETATKALDWVDQNWLPKVRAANHVPDDEQLSIRPFMGLGQDVHFEVYRGAVALPNTEFTLSGLLMTYRRNTPTAQERAAEEQANKRAILKRETTINGFGQKF